MTNTAATKWAEQNQCINVDCIIFFTGASGFNGWTNGDQTLCYNENPYETRGRILVALNNSFSTLKYTVAHEIGHFMGIEYHENEGPSPCVGDCPIQCVSLMCQNGGCSNNDVTNITACIRSRLIGYLNQRECECLTHRHPTSLSTND